MAYTKKVYKKPESVVRVPFKPKFPPSNEQDGIFEVIVNSDANCHIEASPGSGKTTTIVWSMTMEKRKNACMLAHSKAIVTAIEPMCPESITVGTGHSFGYKAVASKFGRLFLSNNKVQKIYCELFPKLDPDNFHGKEKGAAYSAMFDTVKLIDMLRVNLTDENNAEAVNDVASQYNIDVELDKVFPMIKPMYDAMLSKGNVIDFTDMLWLPIRMDLPIQKFDMLYVDERQDLNNLMIEYVKRMTGERVMTVGDKRQSIMAFCGADTESTERLVAAFGGEELPLKVCYRCGTDIVALAAKIYPDILPYDKNPTGSVEDRDELDYEMPEGSMILCRRNAGLIKPCFALLKRGRKATIKGKDIGAGLIKLINQLKATDIFDLVDKIEVHKMSRIEKLMSESKPRTAQIDQISDQCDCIVQISENCSTVNEVVDRINMIFDEATKGIVCSSIHRSKGLEADHVSIVDYSRIRLVNERMTEQDHIQEKNLHFVAVTRAIKSLHLIR